MNAEEIKSKTLEEKAREFLDGEATQEAYDAMLSSDPEKARAILLANFAQQMIDEEREECAKVADNTRIYTNEDCYQLRNGIANQIRFRAREGSKK